MIRFARRGAIVGALVGLVYAAWKMLEARRTEIGVTFEPQPFPMPPRPIADRSTADLAPDGLAAVDPDADGNCPISHPIKGKLGSGIFHPPGAFAYQRTRADRCYRDESAAEDDGLRAAKR